MKCKVRAEFMALTKVLRPNPRDAKAEYLKESKIASTDKETIRSDTRVAIENEDTSGATIGQIGGCRTLPCSRIKSPGSTAIIDSGTCSCCSNIFERES